MHKATIIALLAIASLLPAQADDFGIWYGVSAEKKLSKKASIELDGEFRTRNDVQTADRWSIGLSGDYKLTSWLRAGAGYDFLWNNNRERITRYGDGSLRRWRPSFWSPRHRVHVDLTAKTRVGRFDLSLRERWQYTWRPQHSAPRYDFQDEAWETQDVKGKGENKLRSRFTASYDIPRSKIEPFASVELTNAWDVEKVRYTAGLSWRITKQHSVEACYRYQDVRTDDDMEYDADRHILGLSYKFKF